MFDFGTAPVKFVGLLLLFAWCTAWCVYELTRPQDVRQRVSNVLHLAMAVVMLLMVAGPTWNALTDIVPTSGLVVLFVAATAWFGWLAIDAARHLNRRGAWHFAGHAAMFAAMAWHLAAMAVMASAMSTGMGHPGSGHHGGEMGGGMNMDDWMTAQSQPGGVLWGLALLGLPLMAYLLASSLRSLWLVLQPRATPVACSCGPDCACGPTCRCGVAHSVPLAHQVELVGVGGAVPGRTEPLTETFVHSCHESRPIGSPKFRLAGLADFAMTFGMFWMSTGLLAPILPVFALLSF